MNYFVRIRGKAFGPFTEEQLLEMKSKGKLGKTTEISENKIDWQSAGDLGFLFPPPAPVDSGRGLTTPTSGLAPEPADWFYSADGKEGYGPVTHGSIVQMMQSGTLHGESLVWQQGQNARSLKSEPKFSGAATPNRPPALNFGGTSDLAEASKSDDQTNGGRILGPLADSLGWLMFLKIIYLISVLLMDLLIFAWAIFMISRAIGTDSVQLLLFVLFSIVVNAAFCVLATKVALCFWKYHTDLNHAVVSERESDLVKANRSQALFWKMFGILVVSILALILLSILTAIVIAGFGAGSFERLFLR